MSGDQAAMATLLAAGADPDARNKDGNAAMHLAAWRGDCDELTELIRRKGKVNVANMDGNTPLHFAALRGHQVCCFYLFFISFF